MSKLLTYVVVVAVLVVVVMNLLDGISPVG